MAVPLNDLIGTDVVDLTSIDALDGWMQIGLAVLFVLVVAVVTQRVVLGLVRKAVGKTEGSWDDDLVDVVSSRILFTVIVSAVQVCLLWLQPVLAETTQLYANATLILLAASALSATIKVVLKAFLDSCRASVP